MTKKNKQLLPIPSLVEERLRTWGLCVRTQRIAQQIRSQDLCIRLGVSRPTLLRLEQGEASVNAGTYLAALHILGVLRDAAPAIPATLFNLSPAGRARLEKEPDHDYF